MRIEICGGIAAGKTTLATMLEVPGLDPLMEDFKSIPFWSHFFVEPESYAFETEMSFLLQHYHQVKRSRPRPVLCDFSFYLDRAFANVSLGPREFRVFEAACEEVLAQLGLPSLIIALRCPADVQLARIRQRGRAAEAAIGVDYLQRLNACIGQEVAALAQRMPVIWLDTATADLLDKAGGLGPLREDIRQRLEKPLEPSHVKPT